MTLMIPTPSPFSLERTALLHGWVWLAPYQWDERRRTLSWWEALPSGPLVRVSIRQPSAQRVTLKVEPAASLTAPDRQAIAQRVRRALSLDVDLSEFAALAKRQSPPIWRFLRAGGGRLLRGCSLYEDLVKTLFTTNAAWAYTERMVETFCRLFGQRVPSSERPAWTFPDAEAVRRALLRSPEASQKRREAPKERREALARSARASAGFGYRAAYLAALTERVVTDHIAPTLEHPHIVATRKVEILQALPGFGPYAVHHMLVLLHHFDHLPVDREVLAYLGVAGRSASAQQRRIEAYRRRWGRWAFLGYKLERQVTQRNWIGR